MPLNSKEQFLGKGLPIKSLYIPVAATRINFLSTMVTSTFNTVK